MKQNLQYKILCAVMAIGAIGLTTASPALAAEVDETDIELHANSNTITIGGDNSPYKKNYFSIYGSGDLYAQYDATGGNITIESGTHTLVYGGATYSSIENSPYSAYNNTVTINGETVITEELIGGSGGNSAYNNTVNINNSAKIGNGSSSSIIAGGNSILGDVYNNFVNIGDMENVFKGTINSNIYGGYSTYGNVTNNNVYINLSETGTVQADKGIFGGYTDNGVANDNNVSIVSGNINNYIYGGIGKSAAENSVNIMNAIIANDIEIYGGQATSGDASNNIVNINNTQNTTNADADVYGGDSDSGNAYNNAVTISSSTAGAVQGGNSKSGSVYNNTVELYDSTANSVFGGYSENGYANKNIVHITDTDNTDGITTNVKTSVYGGYSEQGSANENHVYIEGYATTIKNYVYGGHSEQGSVNNNYVDIKDAEVGINVYGGYTEGTAESNGNNVKISAGSVDNDVFGGYSGQGSANNNTVHITNDTSVGLSNIFGGVAETSAENNKVIIDSISTTGKFVTISGAVVDNNNDTENSTATNNEVIINGGKFNNTYIFAASADTAENNNVIISGGTFNSTNIYAAQAFNGTANNNSITITVNADGKNADLSGANLYGYRGRGTGNSLNIDGWSGDVYSVQKFNSLNFTNIDWNRDSNTPILNIKELSDLSETSIDEISFTGGGHIRPGDKYTLIKNNTGAHASYNINPADVTGNYIAGIALEGDGAATAITTTENNNDVYNLVYTVKSVRTSKQADLVTQSRAVAAAFINQGTDLISDSLDTLSRDDTYGVKTFAAVHGNRSKYDVNSDLKINGWSTIVGVGNAAEFTDGDEFSWDVFYENGSGNYRTYNEFNNEFFRGDGSLVYNGGGIAARYENANGVYTEGSLRAGMLKSDMDNALRDGSGNYYGYDSKSAYYGAHIGVGKIISLSESSDLDVYGKFFHTYTEGDSFTVANDKFEFDSITSDRLRLGARVTTNKANAFSTYYGLAYEYEFNGDADMRAQNLAAPTQSLQGSSYMAELGFNYQPTPDSPWSFDLNLRGYAGEREGGSFNVQATYTF